MIKQTIKSRVAKFSLIILILVSGLLLSSHSAAATDGEELYNAIDLFFNTLRGTTGLCSGDISWLNDKEFLELWQSVNTNIMALCNPAKNQCEAGYINNFWRSYDIQSLLEKPDSGCNDRVKNIADEITNKIENLIGGGSFGKDEIEKLKGKINNLATKDNLIWDNTGQLIKENLKYLLENCDDLLSKCGKNALYTQDEVNNIKNNRDAENLLNRVITTCNATFSGQGIAALPPNLSEKCYVITNLKDEWMAASHSSYVPPPPSANDSCYGDRSVSIWTLLFRAIDTLISIIFWILAWIFRWLLVQIVIPVFLWIINPNSWGGMAGSNAMVAGLWSTVKDIANIGLLLTVVAIAIATIFRIKGYELKSTILKLIAAALLINLSLTICGIVIDLSNYITLYFLNSGEAGNLAGNIGIVLDQIACATKKFASNVMPETISAIVILILSIILIGQFIGLIAYTAVRVVTLWLTTILSPLAMVSAILPATKNLWKTWLNYFTTYLVSIPAIAFSLWFIITAATGTATYIISSGGANALIAVVAYAIVWIILFQIPLLVARFLNADAMAKGYNWATKKIRGWLVGGAALTGGAIAKKALLSPQATGAAERLKKVSPTLGLALERKIKGLKESEIKKVEERVAATEDVSLLKNMLKDFRYQRPTTQLAILSRLAEIKNGQYLSDPEIYQRYLDLRQRYKDTEPIKKIEKLMPSWKEIPENYSQLAPYEQQQAVEKFVKKQLDVLKQRDVAKGINWSGVFQDAASRGFSTNLTAEFFSNLSALQFMNLMHAIPTEDRFEFIKNNILLPYKQGQIGPLPQSLRDWLTNSTFAGRPLTQQEISDLTTQGLL